MLTKQKILEYLTYINVPTTDLKPTFPLLKAIHSNHSKVIPFENLTMHYYHKHTGKRIIVSTKIEDIYDKFIKQRRGGFCFEINHMLYHLLKSLGYTVRMMGGHVVHGEALSSGLHLTLLVEKVSGEDPNKKWIVDAGFGALFTEPLLFEENLEQQDRLKDVYRVIFNKSQSWHEIQCKNEENEPWIKKLVIPSLQPKKIEDFQWSLEYVCTNPQSWFTQKRVCIIITEHGRVTLLGNKFTILEKRVRTEREVDEKEVPEILKKYFNINLEEIEKKYRTINSK